jgi:hypothetical protein
MNANTAIPTPRMIILNSNPSIISNEDAYNYWEEKLLKDFANKYDLVNKSYLMTVSFKFKVLKTRTFKEKVLFKYPLEDRQFTTSVFGIKVFKKGDSINGLPIDAPRLWLKVGVKSERKFLEERPVDSKGQFILGTFDNNSNNIIEILFSDIVSITITEVQNKEK